MEIKEIFNRESFDDIRLAWKKYIELRPEGQNTNHLLYTLIRGKDPRIAFKPLTNAIKIENNGGNPFQTLYGSLTSLKSKLQIYERTCEAFITPTERNEYLRKNNRPGEFRLGYSTVTQIEGVLVYKNHDDISFPLTSEQTQYLINQINYYVDIVTRK
jgi:hypothetical protein